MQDPIFCAVVPGSIPQCLEYSMILLSYCYKPRLLICIPSLLNVTLCWKLDQFAHEVSHDHRFFSRTIFINLLKFPSTSAPWNREEVKSLYKTFGNQQQHRHLFYRVIETSFPTILTLKPVHPTFIKTSTTALIETNTRLLEHLMICMILHSLYS